jgi:NADH-quinone oxidoreductase subunit N
VSTLYADIGLALPEIFLLAMLLIALVVDACVATKRRIVTYILAQTTLIGAGILVVACDPGQTRTAFSDSLIVDPMSVVLKAFVLLVTVYAFFYAEAYMRERGQFRGEFFTLGLFAVLGMMVLISGHSLITVYLGLELLSLSLYAMVALQRDRVEASEAAMKFFVLGALASGMLLYGMSMVYGITGTFELSELARTMGHDAGPDALLLLGLVFIVAGVAFKLGAVPFHMWIPDVYQGAPTSVTLFIGSAPKVAAFAMLMRLLVEGMPQLQTDVSQMLAVLAVLSMGLGNIVAIAQRNLKRMLGYSTIAHVGFLLLGIIAGTPRGYAASMFYVMVYALMALGAFAMVIVLSRKGFESDAIEDFKGLNHRSPWYAFLMLILMLSMAGVPPFLGFWAKWSVLRELVASDQVWLAVLAVAFSIVGLFYYLRVIRMMYFEAPETNAALAPGFLMWLMMSTNALAVLALGIAPGALMALCTGALAG